MANWTLLLAAINGGVAVALGAFGAHGLRARLEPEQLAVWQTAVLYQLVHAVALLGVGLWLLQQPRPGVTFAGGLFAAGMLLFSGSLYLLALGAPRWLGPITPLGGLCFLMGWLSLAWVAWHV